ncbi:hypothetical protein BDA99DRAFT_493384 [Phascolomyces articulosus]|uniref:Uncharacterized protein n=1 Tax=Phascolomyces articulosus TaxID=60185 RepID=A0AAD5KCV0_9FUNG|nr:hypothetical protein BDA99DRAFT_493384 [Phascolomyces articulosus]
MSNKNDAYSSSSAYIRDLSYNKLAHYYHSTKDTSIRKYVLITNILRLTHLDNVHTEQDYYHSTTTTITTEDPMEIDHYNDTQDDALEQQWLDSCLDELEKEEQTWSPLPPTVENQQKQQEQEKERSCHYLTHDDHDQNKNTMSKQDQQQSTQIYFHAGVVACFSSIEYSLK